MFLIPRKQSLFIFEYYGEKANMRMYDIITKKKNDEELTKEEIDLWPEYGDATAFRLRDYKRFR